MGHGALTQTIEPVADTISQFGVQPAMRRANFLYDYATKGKKTAVDNLVDLEQQQRKDLEKEQVDDFLNSIGYEEAFKDTEKNSLLTDTGRMYAEMLGGQVPAAVIGSAIPMGPTAKISTKGLKGTEKLAAMAKNIGRTYYSELPGHLINAARSYGGGMNEALKDGATMPQAMLYGLANAGIEEGTEMMTGGIPGLSGTMKSGLDDYVDPLLNKVKNPLLRASLNTGYRMAGEGLEESASEILNPFAKKIYSNEPINPKQVAQNALRAFGPGAILGAILNGPQSINNFQEAGIENQIRKLDGLNEVERGALTEITLKNRRGEALTQEDMATLQFLNQKANSMYDGTTAAATQRAQQVEQALQNGQITQQQANQELQAINNVLNQPQQNETQQANQEQNQQEMDLPFETEETTKKDSKFKNLDEKDLNRLKQIQQKQAEGKNLTNQEKEDLNYFRRKENGVKFPELSKSDKINKADMAKYYYNADMDNFDNTMLNKAKEVVEANRQGKRTKQQWLDVAKNIGTQASNMDAESLKKYAYASFLEAKPNQGVNLNKQGQKYVGFGINEWINAVYDGAGVGRQAQETNNVAFSKQNIDRFNNQVETSLENKKSQGTTRLGRINEKLIGKIKSLLGIDVTNRVHTITNNDIRHMLNEHGNPDIEAKKGQIAINENDIKKIPDIIENPTDIEKGTDHKLGQTIRYIKKDNSNTTYVVEVVPDDSNSLIIKTMWKKPSTLDNSISTPISTSETQGSDISSTSAESISQPSNNVNKQSLQEQTPARERFVYESSDNSKIDNLRKSVSQYMDNSKKTKSLVSTIEKVIKDKNYNVVFDDTIGDNVNGRISIENGEVSIKLNPDSARAGEFIVTHEITHAIDTKQMRDLVMDHAKKDAKFNEALQSLKETYGTEDVSDEVLADVSGQLFGNQEFINNLSTTKPSIFKKFYNKIVSLANKITGNSNEALFIRDLRNKWETAYREANIETARENLENETKLSKEQSNNNAFKKQQNEIIQKSNPRDKDLGEHTWINSVEDIKTYQEALNSDEYENGNLTPDMTEDMVSKALETGKMTVYSSYPIEQGTFVTPSKMEAQSYAGDSKVYSKEIALNDVAWIDSLQGQYAKVEENNNTQKNISIQDNEGRKLSKKQQNFFKDVAPEVRDENGNLKTVYHTTTDEVAQFNEFNPVGTPYYRFGDQVVNYYTDSKDMSGSYASQDYKMADTKKINNIDEAKDYLKQISDLTGNEYNISKHNTMWGVTQDKQISKEARQFIDSLTENEKQQMLDNIWEEPDDSPLKNSNYDRVFSWNNFDKALQKKYNALTEKYLGTADTVAIQQEVMKYLESPVLLNEDNRLNGEVVGIYETEDELFRNLKSDLQKQDWSKNSKIQYEGYVNITNPYVVDAEERNWNQVVQQSNEFIDELEERVPQETKDNLTRLYNESANKSNEARDNYEVLEPVIRQGLDGYLSSVDEDIRKVNKVVNKVGFQELNDYLDNGVSPGVNFWYDIAEELENQGLIGQATKSFIIDDFKLPEQVKNLIKDNYTKKIPVQQIQSDDISKVAKQVGSEPTLRDLYEKNYENYQEFDKYRMPNSYFLESISKDSSEPGFVDIGYDLNDMFESRAERFGADQVSEELAQAASVGFSKPELIRLWGTSKTTNDIVKEIIASNKDGTTNYDGVIIKNVVDYGGKAGAEGTKANDLFITFNSNQFKAADNLNPTNDPDIRYSQQDGKWQTYLEDRYKASGTRTNLADIRLPKGVDVATTPQQVINNFKQAQKGKVDTTKLRSWVNTSNEATGNQNTLTQADKNAITYEVQSNQKTAEMARKNTDGLSYEQKVFRAENKLNSNQRVTAVDLAEAQMALLEANERGDIKTYLNLQQDIAIMGTELGQAVQAMSMIQKMSPDGQIAMLNKIVNRQQNLGNKTYEGVQLNEELVQKVLDSYDDASHTTFNKEQMDQAVDELKQDIADQMKVSKTEKINAWRYLSMLGNPKTHIRNVVANGAMTAVKRFKDTLNAAGQDIFIRDKANKTTTLKSASKDVKALADVAYNETFNKTQKGNKYNEMTELENKRKIFNNKILEAARKFNDTALTTEDQAFKKINFKKSFSKYLTAQGISTAEQINENPAIVEAAKAFALQEAKVATFNQENKLAQKIIAFDNLNPVARVVRGAIIPFARTPLNIAKTGLEYTPGAGLATTYADFKKAPANMKGAVVVDGISKQITGTSLALLGYALAKSGILTGMGGDDKEDKFKKDQGAKMDYSIKIGDTSYDLSWLSPSAMPMFVGARMYEIIDKQEGLDENVLIESLASTLDPLSELSCISSFTKVLQSYQKGSMQMISEMSKSTAQNYISQFVPTVASQFARVFDDTKRTTNADRNSSGKFTQETMRMLQYKIPGLRNFLPESTDYFGNDRKENENILVRAWEAFLSPANTKKDTMSDESRELVRIYEVTGNDDVLPSGLQKYINYNNNKYDMSSKEYNQFKKDYGTAFQDNLKELMNSDGYKMASDDDRAEMIAGLMKYSKDKAKDNYLTEQGEDYVKTTSTGKTSLYESDKADSFTNNNFSISDYYMYKVTSPKVVTGNQETVRNKIAMTQTFGIDPQVYSDYLANVGKIKADTYSNGKTIPYSKQKKVMAYINSLPLTAQQKAILYKKQYKGYRGADRQIINAIQNSNMTAEEKYSLAAFLNIK